MGLVWREDLVAAAAQWGAIGMPGRAIVIFYVGRAVGYGIARTAAKLLAPQPWPV
jgi:hypothetical protein